MQFQVVVTLTLEVTCVEKSKVLLKGQRKEYNLCSTRTLQSSRETLTSITSSHGIMIVVKMTKMIVEHSQRQKSLLLDILRMVTTK